MNDTAIGAFIGVVGTILGVVVAFAFTLLHESAKDEATRKRLAAVLVAELMNQADYVLSCCTIINRSFIDAPHLLLSEDDLKEQFPPKARVYNASLAQLSLLPHNVSSHLVLMYNEMQKVVDATKIPLVNNLKERETTSSPQEKWITKSGDLISITGPIYMHRWAEL